jgi:hypothetical protein
MRLTIVVPDSNVGVDGVFHQLDLSNCQIPSNVHALQWYETDGEIEFVLNSDRTKPMNETITVLPSWANFCVTAWEAWTPPVAPVDPTDPTTPTGTTSP